MTTNHLPDYLVAGALRCSKINRVFLAVSKTRHSYIEGEIAAILLIYEEGMWSIQLWMKERLVKAYKKRRKADMLKQLDLWGCVLGKVEEVRLGRPPSEIVQSMEAAEKAFEKIRARLELEEISYTRTVGRPHKDALAPHLPITALRSNVRIFVDIESLILEYSKSFTAQFCGSHGVVQVYGHHTNRNLWVCKIWRQGHLYDKSIFDNRLELESWVRGAGRISRLPLNGWVPEVKKPRKKQNRQALANLKKSPHWPRGQKQQPAWRCRGHAEAAIKLEKDTAVRIDKDDLAIRVYWLAGLWFGERWFEGRVVAEIQARRKNDALEWLEKELGETRWSQHLPADFYYKRFVKINTEKSAWDKLTKEQGIVYVGYMGTFALSYEGQWVGKRYFNEEVIDSCTGDIKADVLVWMEESNAKSPIK